MTKRQQSKSRAALGFWPTSRKYDRKKFVLSKVTNSKDEAIKHKNMIHRSGRLVRIEKAGYPRYYGDPPFFGSGKYAVYRRDLKRRQ